MSLAGHLRTLGSYGLRTLRPPQPPPWEPWTTTLEDPEVGTVRLRGRLTATPGADTLLVLVHGLGGCAESPYMAAGARGAASAGLAALRLSVRGAERDGEDIFHAGLTADLHAALASPAAAPYDRVLVLGYSLGGHVALRHAAEPGDPRLAATAALCSPLDLAVCADAIDRPSAWLYRRHLMTSLHEIHAAIAARRPLTASPERVAGTRRIREFDDLVVAPRHGFAGAADYYARASAGPRLAGLRVPALLVTAPGDPMVPAAGVDGWDAPRLEVRRPARSGHLAFPRHLDLGERAPLGCDAQVVGWLLRQNPAP